MRFTTNKEELLKPLQSVIGVVKKRAVLPILSHVLVQVSHDEIRFTGSNTEMQLISSGHVEHAEAGEVCVEAQKFLEVVRNLKDDSQIECELVKDELHLHAGRSIFVFNTLPAHDFPLMESWSHDVVIDTVQEKFRFILETTHYAIANVEYRIYFCGLLLEIREGYLRAVASDGHRMAISDYELNQPIQSDISPIIPRQAVQELLRILDTTNEPLQIRIGRNRILFETQQMRFTTSLIDSTYPDYRIAMPKNKKFYLTVDKGDLKGACLRVATLTNEQFRRVEFSFDNNEMTLKTANNDKQLALESLPIEYQEGLFSLKFNINFILDVLNIVKGEHANISIMEPANTMVFGFTHEDNPTMKSMHVVMPMGD